MRSRRQRAVALATGAVALSLLVPAHIVTASAEPASGLLPSPVRDVVVSSKSGSEVHLSWQAADGNGSEVSDYIVEFSRDAGSWTVVNDGVSSQTTASVTGLVQRDTYYFRVSALNAVGRGLPTVAGGTRRLSLGDGVTCTVLKDALGTCWGDNGFGQIGDGTTTMRRSPTSVAGGVSVAEVAVGSGFTCAVDTSGRTWCWGRGDSGQLGNGFRAHQPAATRVSQMPPAQAVAAGGDFACAVLVDRTVRCWGANGRGQIGNGTFVDSLTPSVVTGLSDVVQIAAGRSFACARTADGRIWCWGDNASGQLVTGGAVSAEPVPVDLASEVKDVAAGRDHVCVLNVDNTVSCWGANAFGQVGSSEFTESNDPAAVVGLGAVAKVAAGGNTSCALLLDGTVRCWGENTWGQVGALARTENRPRNCGWPGCAEWAELFASNTAVPVEVRGVQAATDLAVGRDHACAVTVGNEVRCWGHNESGQIGY
ncbi:MAG: fibronectin type III domain-containing protein, partial [Actinomycetales bacterium]|nr:fibronectin type III domain-containing protein [Actinomycetales bacterium]